MWTEDVIKKAAEECYSRLSCIATRQLDVLSGNKGNGMY